MHSISFESLVDDIICIVFQHASITAYSNLVWQDISFYSPRRVLKLRSVCRKWKRIAQGHAVLWTYIHLTGRNFELIQLQLRFSGKAPIHILYDHDPASLEAFSTAEHSTTQIQKILRENIPRASSLFVVDHGTRGIPDTLEIVLTYAAPCLRTWGTIITPARNSQINCLLYPFAGSTPLLRHVLLQYYLPHEDAKVWDGLYSVAITLLPRGSTERDITSFFQRSPELQSLSSNGVGWKVRSSSVLAFEMSHLVSLQLLQVKCVDIMPLLQVVNFPSLKVLAIISTNDDSTRSGCTSFCKVLRMSPGLQSLLSKLRFLDMMSLGGSVLRSFTFPDYSLHLNFNESYHEVQFEDIFRSFPNVKSLCISISPVQRRVFELPDFGVSTNIEELRIGGHLSVALLQSLLEKKMLPGLRKVFVRSRAIIQEELAWEIIHELLSVMDNRASQGSCVEIYGFEDDEIALMKKFFEDRDVLVLVGGNSTTYKKQV